MNSVLFVAGVDPNIATDETRKIPVLFAAERGHYEVLRVFKRHNYEQSVLPGKIFKMVRFDKWTRYKDETVLHLALKRSLLGLHQVRYSKIQRISGERIFPNQATHSYRYVYTWPLFLFSFWMMTINIPSQTNVRSRESGLKNWR